MPRKSLFANSTLLALIVALAIDPADARPANERLIMGAIDSYECGDNCYLTIIDRAKKKITGLCVARECAAWNFETRMPSFFIGKEVVVTIGKGVQLNGSGEVMSTMVSFTSIKFRP